MSHEIARSMQMSAQDTVRWGDRLGVSFPVGGAGIGNSGLAVALQTAQGLQGKQLVNMHWRWPCAWQVALTLVPQFAAAETGVLTVAYQIAFGSGNNIVLPFVETVTGTGTAAGNAVLSVIDTSLILPAQDIQITVTSLTTATDSHAIGFAGSIEIGAFVAPQTEVHALTHMLECLCKITPTEERDPGAGWMPPGYFPEPLAYRR